MNPASIIMGAITKIYNNAREQVPIRGFSRGGSKRILFICYDHAIAKAQINAFINWKNDAEALYQAELRFVGQEYYHGRQNHVADADIVLFQTYFTLDRDQLDNIINVIRARNPRAKIVYLDWFAPTDLRLASLLDPQVHLYVKKHILSDLSEYGKPTFGDTTLMDHYGRLSGQAHTTQCFPIPEGFLDKLLVGPTFFTAPYLLRLFKQPAPTKGSLRDIDLHARLAVQGSGWYQYMRTESVAVVAEMKGVKSVTKTGIPLREYLSEMRRSKLCFSPFGYGEVCWRDYEAAALGAALVKPDMSHVRTDPDIFVPWETYAPVRWDLLDLPEVVQRLLSDGALRQKLADNAFDVLHNYVRRKAFLNQMAPLFAL